MSSVIQWLNANSGVVGLLFSFVVAGATVAYVVLTRQLVRETRATREEQIEAHIAVRVQANQIAFGFLDLIVENLGPAPAYDVTFKFHPDVQLEDNPPYRLSDIGFLRNGVRYLPPHQPLATYLIRMIGIPNERLEGPSRLNFTVEVRYQDALKRDYHEQFEIDFAHLVGMTRLGSPPLPEMEKHLKKIAESLGRLESGWSKLNVVDYSPEDVERERANFRVAQLSPQLIDDATKTGDKPGGEGDAA